MNRVTHNGDEVAKVQPTKAGLDRILRIARIRDAADANEAIRERSRAIERARQARVRARRDRA